MFANVEPSIVVIEGPKKWLRTNGSAETLVNQTCFSRYNVNVPDGVDWNCSLGFSKAGSLAIEEEGDGEEYFQRSFNVS